MTQRSQEIIRVVVVDDHPLILAGTCRSLAAAPGIQVVGLATTGGEALRLLAECEPDVLLLDVRLPDVSGVEVARTVRERHARTAIVVLTAHYDQGHLDELRRLGVRACLPKSASGETIVAAVRAAARGETLPPPEPPRSPLSPRELQVLRRVVQGRSATQIARELGLDVRVVEDYVRVAYARLGIASRAGAAAQLKELGLAGPEQEGPVNAALP